MKKGITLISLVITIIIILILAGVGISGSLSLIEEAKYTAFINDIKQKTEAVSILIAEKQLGVAGTDEKIELFAEDLKIELSDIPKSLQNEIKYIRALLAETEEEEKKKITEDLPSGYNDETLEIGEEGKNIYFLPNELSGGKNQAYIYDEQSGSVYKKEPTIIWGVEMHGYDYGNLLVSQSGLLQKAQNNKDNNEENNPGTSNEYVVDLQNATYTGDMDYLEIQEDYIVINSVSNYAVKAIYMEDLPLNEYDEIRITYSFTAGYDWSLILIDDEENQNILDGSGEGWGSSKSVSKTTNTFSISEDINYTKLRLASSSLNAKLYIYEIVLIKNAE